MTCGIDADHHVAFITAIQKFKSNNDSNEPNLSTPVSHPSMADTSGFITGDDFISFDLGEPGGSPGPSKSPSPGPILHDSYRPSNNKGKGKARAEDSASEPVSGTSKSSKKKRKGDPAGSAEKRVKTKKSPQPRPADEPGPRNLKEERRARERGAPWAHDMDWDRCRDPAEM